jgi:hypothetical protein
VTRLRWVAPDPSLRRSRIAADLACGHHSALIGELQALSVEHPEREAICGSSPSRGIAAVDNARRSMPITDSACICGGSWVCIRGRHCSRYNARRAAHTNAGSRRSRVAPAARGPSTRRTAPARYLVADFARDLDLSAIEARAAALVEDPRQVKFSDAKSRAAWCELSSNMCPRRVAGRNIAMGQSLGLTMRRLFLAAVPLVFAAPHTAVAGLSHSTAGVRAHRRLRSQRRWTRRPARC